MNDTEIVDRRSHGNAREVHTVHPHTAFFNTITEAWRPLEGPALGCPIHLHNQEILKYSKVIRKMCNTDEGRQAEVKPQAAGGPYRSLARRCAPVTLFDSLKDDCFDLLTIPTVDSVTPYRRQLDGLLVWRKQLVEVVRIPAVSAFATKAVPAQYTTILVVVARFDARHTQRGNVRLAWDHKTSTTDPQKAAHIH